MSVVDSTLKNAPGGANVTSGKREFSVNCKQIIMRGSKAASTNGQTDNSGNCYLVRQFGSRDDQGTIVAIIPKGTTVAFPPAGVGGVLFSPYRYYVDVDNIGDGLLVTLIL